MEYGLLSPERIAQLEQEDLERYQRSVLKNPSYQDDEATDYQDELQSKLLVLRDMMDQFCKDLKGLTSPSENGSEPPMMLPHPVSTIYDDVACAEPQTNEDSVVVDLPDSEEMQVFDDKNGTGSLNSEEMLHSEETVVSASAIDSQFSVNPSLHKQLTIVESGFKVLSIYCAHMAPKWNNILELRPKQRNYMSVEDYYNQFFTWRKKLEEVNYIGDEDSYIDDFLYGLKTELAVRVWVYKWKPLTLYGAFRRAEMEETMMKKDAHMVFDKNSEQNECANEPGTMDLHLEGSNYGVNKHSALGITRENPVADVIHDVKWLVLAECSKWEHNDGLVFGDIVVQKRARKVFAGMIGTILEDELLGIKATNAAHYMLDEKATRSPVNSDEDLYGKMDSETSFSYNLQFSRGINGSDILGVSVANSQSLSKLGFNPQVFDPGTLAFFKEEEYVSLHFISSELLLVYSLVYGADNSINMNGISMLTRATSSNRPFSDFHVGALAQICPNGDQAAPWISHGHDIVVGNSNVYVRTVNTLIQRVPLGDEYCFFDFSHFRLFKSDSHAIISLIYDNIAHGDGFSKSLVARAYSKSISKLLCYCILSLDSLTNELGLVNCFGSWIGLVSPLRAEFTWDPGICVIFAYILEDKDDFKWVGKWIVLMEHRTALTFIILNLMIYKEDHFGAITLQQAGDVAYAFTQFYIQTLYPRYCKFGWGRTPILWPFWCTVDSEVIALEVKGGAHHILTEDMYAQECDLSSFGLDHRHFYFGNYPLLDVVEISMLVFDPGGSFWFHMVWCSFKTNDDQQDFDFGFGERNDGAFCTSFRWKVCLNEATMLGLVSSIVAQLSQFNISLCAACNRFNAYKLLRWKFLATILLLVEVLSKLLGDRVLTHLIALAGGDYTIKIFVDDIMVKSGSNACNSASLLDSGINTFGNVIAIIYHSFKIHLAAAVKSMVLVRSEREIQECPSFGLENFIWNPGIVDLVCSYVTLPRSRYTILYDHSVLNEHTKNNVAAILPSQAALLQKMLFHRSYLTIENPVSSQFMKSGQPHYDNIVHLQDTGWRPAIFMLLLRKSEPASGTMVDTMKDLGLNERSACESVTKHKNGIGTYSEIMGQGHGVNKCIECLPEASWLCVAVL